MNPANELHAILPYDEIRSRFEKPVALRQMGLDEWDAIVARDANAILNMSFTVWNRFLSQNPGANPAAAREHQRTNGGDFIGAVQAVIGQPVVRDISFSRCTIDDSSIADSLVAYLLVAHVYPNHLHLANMNFVNPYKPIPPNKQRYRFRKYKGLGLSGTVLARCEDYAVANGCDRMTLTAATDDLVPLFNKYGFELSDDDASSLAMEKKLSS